MGRHASFVVLRARHGDQYLVVTSTYNGNRYASNATAGMILDTMPPSARTNAPVAIDGWLRDCGATLPWSPARPPVLLACWHRSDRTIPGHDGLIGDSWCLVSYFLFINFADLACRRRHRRDWERMPGRPVSRHLGLNQTFIDGYSINRCFPSSRA